MTRQVRGTCSGQKRQVRESNCLVPGVGRAICSGMKSSLKIDLESIIKSKMPLIIDSEFQNTKLNSGGPIMTIT